MRENVDNNGWIGSLISPKKERRQIRRHVGGQRSCLVRRWQPEINCLFIKRDQQWATDYRMMWVNVDDKVKNS